MCDLTSASSAHSSLVASGGPIFWRLAWRTLWRDLRAGELRLLLVALTLAVAALSAVAFFSNRLDVLLRRDAAQLLGGDLVLSSDHPLPAAYAAKAAELGLQTAMTQTFPTMARAPEELGGAGRLVSLKAVSHAYPLRGALRVGGSGGCGRCDTVAYGASRARCGICGHASKRTGYIFCIVNSYYTCCIRCLTNRQWH